MPKSHFGDLCMPIAERKKAMALLATIRGENQAEAKVAAQSLLETASFVTWLVEVAWLTRQDLIREACKDYRFFPLLIASSKGRDTKQKLNRVDFLPIGENHPFKRLSGKARNDNLRDWIERSYDTFKLIQRGGAHLVDPIAPTLVAAIRDLPELSKSHARQWAEAMVRHRLEGPGGEQFPRALGIDLSGETKKRVTRKNNRMRDKFGGDRLSMIPADSGFRFIAHTGNVARGKELDPIVASHLEHRIKHPPITEPTFADSKNALIDRLEKRIVSILK